MNLYSELFVDILITDFRIKMFKIMLNKHTYRKDQISSKKSSLS